MGYHDENWNQEDCNKISGRWTGSECVVKESVAKYLDDSLKSDPQGTHTKGWGFLKNAIPEKLKAIIDNPDYWKLTYNSEKEQFIHERIGEDLSIDQTKQLGSFVYIYNDKRREMARQKEEQDIINRGYEKISSSQKELDGKQVSGIFNVSSMGMLGSEDKLKELEGTLKYSDYQHSLMLIPKRARTRGFIIQGFAFIKKDAGSSGTSIVETKNEADGSPGYQVRINGRPVQVAMGENNWFPTRAEAEEYERSYKAEASIPFLPKQLPIVNYEGKKWFFDERLRQIRTVTDATHRNLEFQDLDDFEMKYFQDMLAKKKEERFHIELEGSKLNAFHSNDLATNPFSFSTKTWVSFGTKDEAQKYIDVARTSLKTKQHPDYKKYLAELNKLQIVKE